MEVERESQWVRMGGVFEVAGTLTSKSSTPKLPASCGDTIDPPMLPLNVARPFSTTGNSAGPRTTATKGSQSARLEVESDRRSADEEERVPEACTRLVGVVRLNCGSSRVSLAAW